MEKEELKSTFHSLFNKINNIFTAVGSNKEILNENLDKLTTKELKDRIAELSHALAMIEKNITALNKILQDTYESLAKELHSTKI